MKSIQTKFLILVTISLFVSVMVVTCVGALESGEIIREDASEIMSLLCKEKKQEVNEKLLNVEQSVKTMYQYTLTQMVNADDSLTTGEKIDACMDKVKELALHTAESTDGAIATYWRANPAISGPTAGFFWVSDKKGGFYEYEVTDISKYEKDDIEHVGWYHIPIANGKETWMSPYMNENLGFYMISYIIPIFVDGEEIGIVGMDVEMQLLYDYVDSVDIYDTGYAFLMSEEGEIYHHQDPRLAEKWSANDSKFQEVFQKMLAIKDTNTVAEYTWQEEEKYVAVESLANHMLFAIAASKSEIDKPRREMIRNMFLFVSVIILLCMIITIHTTKNIVGPLNDLAYFDVLTGLSNKTAYEAKVDKLEQEIEGKQANFAVAVLDINNLKIMNDTYGHDKGDMLIQDAAIVMMQIWGRECLYRVGGDEFVVIMDNPEPGYCDSKKDAMDNYLKVFNMNNDRYDMDLQIAVGISELEDTDTTYLDVFKRADERMYEDKARKKENSL